MDEETLSFNFIANTFQTSNGECQHVKGAEVKQEWFAFVSSHNSNETYERPLGLFYGTRIANLTYCFYKNYGNHSLKK